MKVIYVGGTCDFCTYVQKNYPASYVSDETTLDKGRAYTVTEKWPVSANGHDGFGIRLAEVELPPFWGHCSCQFREIDGDKDAWTRTLEENRPKTKELEPA